MRLAAIPLLYSYRGKRESVYGSCTELPVNMTFTVTAKERYLWTLALKRRGLSVVGVLR